jgi:hypothetical protein
MVNKSPSEIEAMHLVEFWIKECKKVAFKGYSQIQLRQVWHDAMMEEGSSNLEETIIEPTVD